MNNRPSITSLKILRTLFLVCSFVSLSNNMLAMSAVIALPMVEAAQDHLMKMLKAAVVFTNEGIDEEALRCFAYVAEHATTPDARKVAINYLKARTDCR